MKRYFRRRASSFYYAFKGIHTLLRTQPNAVLHLAATVLAIGAGFAFSISRAEWLALIIVITLVWMAEAFNTALEFLTDLASPHYHPLAGKAKDVAAAAVLLAAIGAALAGLLIFGPHVLAYFHAWR